MGLRIDRETFHEDDYAAFAARLDDSMEVLAGLLRQPGFGEGPTTIGAELECQLVGPDLRPFLANQEILAAVDDPRWTVEIDRFNVEANLAPATLRGRSLEAMQAQLEGALASLRRAADHHDARVAAVGILPTVTLEDLRADAITDEPRYRALDVGLRRLRGAPFRIDIRGRDHLQLSYDHVSLEGANTSFQLHLRATPEEFPDLFDAAQIATGPVLAVAGNSPLLLNRRLWDETRIPMFQQATEDRPPGAHDRPARVGFGPGWAREGVVALLRHAVEDYDPVLPAVGEDTLEGDPPTLEELRLHVGTVWWWNRPVYDPTLGGHLRIELRALPSGPTPVDMVANAALLLGLTLGLAPAMPDTTARLPFEVGRDDWYRAAREGPAARLHWPDGDGGIRQRPATDLVRDLLPTAADGLVGAGVERSEAERWLTVIDERAASGQTGARWQVATFERLRADGHADPAAGTLAAYLDNAATGVPVHTW